jgi:superfamily II DNA or RNA helicase
MFTPADLARPRPKPPSQPPPSRSRGSADVEKERAQRALRALVADPAADFAALPADEFFAALKCACQDGVANPALIADAGRRITSGESGPRELHQVLLAAPDHHAWAEARIQAMEAVARAPEMAISVVSAEAQRLGVAGMQVTESAEGAVFTAVASLDRDGTRVEGTQQYGGNKKTARQAAAVSLLAELTGLAVPDHEPLAVWSAGVGQNDMAAPAAALAKGLTASELELWLDHEAGKPEPDPELLGFVRSGALSTRSLYLLLFEANPQGWADARATAWEALISAPSAAGGVLSMYSQARSWPTVRYVEAGEYSAVAAMPLPGGLVVGEPCHAAGPKAARAGAALALLRELAPPAAVVPEAPVSDRNPVAVLNEWSQRGDIAALSYEQAASGPPHAPVFTCTVTCTHVTGSYAGVADGSNKNEAKVAAAAGLLEQLAAQEQSAVVRLARAVAAEARSPQGILGRLVRVGCALDFQSSRQFRIGHPAGAELAVLANWDVPLMVALPVLAALDMTALDVAADRLHASVRTWAAATRSALEAISTRRVYPALDAEGRDCWRLAADLGAASAGPSDSQCGPSALLDDFLDAVANAMLRPPGARFVVGDEPYAGRARVLAGDAADWADRCAEAADPTPPKPMSVRIHLPADDGSPLRAELRAEYLGHAEHRLLRRATRRWPPLARIRHDGEIRGEDAVELLGPAGEQLAALGITVEWPSDLVRGLGASTVLQSRSAVGSSAHGGLGDIVDLSWQLTLDDDPLSEAEAEAVAAQAGLVRLRERWVLIDPATVRRARERTLGEVSGAQALAGALTGQIAVDGRDIPCFAAGRLADLIGALRDAGEQASADIPDGLEATLRGYQRIAVQWLARTTALGFGALLADDMGLGKTLTVITFHLQRAAGPTLVVCPASLLANWEREFARFAPGVPVRRYHGTARSLGEFKPGQVIVTTYGTLLRDADELAGVRWDMVVADEAQQVKNHRSQAARALRSVSAGARIAVTGTPVENSLSELWAILDWTNPGLFGTLSAFRERYGRAAEGAVGRAAEGGAEREAWEDAARRLSRLISPFLMRRRKTDPGVAPELPDKVVSDRFVQLTGEQAALYKAATTETLARIQASTGIARRGQVLRLLQSLRQICNSPAHFLRQSADDWDADVEAARSGKLATLEELMDSVTSAGEAGLIFTGYVSMGHLLRAHLLARGMTAEFLHGGTPTARRQEMVDRFQSGHGHALILSVRAAGTGLNLTRAGHVIHFDRPWNPAVEDQATDRAHRIGQHRTVNVHHLIAEGTVEDRIAALLARKRKLTEAVLASGESALTELDDGELRALVSLSQDLGSGGAA